jgi:diguanylate cyclase (GGDEF)-like protein
MIKPGNDLPELLQHQLKSCRTLPSVPAVVVRILELCRDEDVAIDEIAQVVSRDPSLATKLLRVSNSAFYAIRYEVTTVNRAISVLGINATLSLTLSFSLAKNLRKSDGTGFDHIAFWRRSAIAAAAGRILAGPANKNLREEFFLSGLLQDIGMLTLNEALPKAYDPLIAEAKGSHRKLVDLEREHLGTDHAIVGAWLLEHWNIPEKYQVAVAASHDPSIAMESEAANLGMAAFVSGQIAEIWTDPFAATGVARDAAIDCLGMSPERFESLLGEVAAAIPEVTNDLGINIGGEDMVNQLLDQAREALVTLSMQAQKQVQEIRDLSRQDRLTSVYNRNYLEDVLLLQFEAASRSGQPLSVLFIDIDHFKKVNDTYGHEMGDTVLVGVAGIIRAGVRASDIITRYGGDEFVCLLPKTTAQEAGIIGERLLAAIASSPQLTENKKEIRITISLGCATYSRRHSFNDPKQLLSAADRCLYTAKAAGRNRLAMMDSTTAEDCA